MTEIEKQLANKRNRRCSSFFPWCTAACSYLAPLPRNRPSCLAHRCSDPLPAHCVVVNNGGFGRRIIFSFYHRGPGYLLSTSPGSLPRPSARGSLQASVGETDQTRKVGLGRLRATCGRTKARQHRPCVKRGSVPAAPARGGGEV